jgi:antirestriction protein ArdC
VKAQGGHVKKGEKGSQIIFYKTLDVKEEKAEGHEEEKSIPMMRYFTVFNRAQCDGLPAPAAEVSSENDPLEGAETFVRNTGAVIQHGGDQAFYMSLHDKIVMPNLASFSSSAAYYGTLMHELTHWTSHETRCNRQLGKRFGDMDYAAEELIAELGAAFVCGEIGISTDLENHASYLAHWIKLLKSDEKAIFTAAAAAAKASDYLNSLQVKADSTSAACG